MAALPGAITRAVTTTTASTKQRQAHYGGIDAADECWKGFEHNSGVADE